MIRNILLFLISSCSILSCAPPPPTNNEDNDKITIEQLQLAIGKSHFSKEVHAIRKRLVSDPTAVYFASELAGNRFFHNWTKMGISLHFNDKSRLETVFLFSQGQDGFDSFKGSLVNELRFADHPADIRKKLGDPEDVDVGQVGDSKNDPIQTRFNYPSKGLFVGLTTGGDPDNSKATIAFVGIMRKK